MATKSPKTPTDLEALTVRIHRLKDELGGVQATIKREVREAEVARDGFDRMDLKNAALVPELSKRGAIPEERLQAFASWQRGRLAELMTVQKDIELSLSMARGEWQDLHNKWRTTNAEALQVEATQRAQDLGVKIIHRQQRQQALRQRIVTITTVTAQREAALADHDAAVAAAIVEGTTAPEMGELPELPAETVNQIEAAIKLLDREIDELKPDQKRASDEAKALQNLIDQRRVDEFTDMIVSAAKEQGLRLESIRDAIVNIAGPTVSAMVDADSAAAYRHELATLRPEVEKLRADNRVLQDGITKLTSRSY